MSLGTTIVAGSVGVVFPCMLIVLVVVVVVGPILILYTYSDIGVLHGL